MASSSSTSDSFTEKKSSSPSTETPPLSTFIDMDSIDNSSSSVNSNPTTNGSQENIKLVSADPHNNELGLQPDTNNQMMASSSSTSDSFTEKKSSSPNTETQPPEAVININSDDDPVSSGNSKPKNSVSADSNNNQSGPQCPPHTNNQMMQANQNTPATSDAMTAPNTVLSLTVQAAIAFAFFHYQTLSSSSSSTHIGHPSVPLHIAGIANVFAFATAFNSFLLHEPHPKAAAIFGKLGLAFVALEFFVMMAVFLPSISQWISWLAGIGCFIAFVYSLLKMR